MRLFCIVPTQNAPSGPTLPSFSRLSGRSGSTIANVSKAPPKVPTRDAVAQADDGGAVAIESDRGREVRRGPLLAPPVAKPKPVDAPAPDIDPDEGVAPVVVDEAFADDVLRVEDQWLSLISASGHEH